MRKRSKNFKTNRYNINNISLEDAEEIICKYNELYPKDSLCGGLFKYIDKLRTESCKLQKQNDSTKKSLRLMEKQYKEEKANMQKKNKEWADKYDIKKITVNAMEVYLASLDDEYMKVKVLMQSSTKNKKNAKN